MQYFLFNDSIFFFFVKNYLQVCITLQKNCLFLVKILYNVIHNNEKNNYKLYNSASVQSISSEFSNYFPLILLYQTLNTVTDYGSMQYLF